MGAETETKVKKKKKKGAYGKVLGFCVLAGCVAALLGWLGSGGFGFGGGSGFGLPWGQQGEGNGSGGDGNAGSGYVQQNNENNDEETNNEASGYDPYQNGGGVADEGINLTIRVSGNTIYHGEDEVSSYALIRLFEGINQPGFVWELVDDQAILETLENVRMLMRENGVDFTDR